MALGCAQGSRPGLHPGGKTALRITFSGVPGTGAKLHPSGQREHQGFTLTYTASGSARLTCSNLDVCGRLCSQREGVGLPAVACRGRCYALPSVVGTHLLPVSLNFVRAVWEGPTLSVNPYPSPPLHPVPKSFPSTFPWPRTPKAAFLTFRAVSKTLSPKCSF